VFTIVGKDSIAAKLHKGSGVLKDIDAFGFTKALHGD
jgi:hypothetical protein